MEPEQLLEASDWLTAWQKDPMGVRNRTAKLPKWHIRDLLHKLEAMPADSVRVGPGRGLLATEHLSALLSQQRAKPPARQYLRVQFSSNHARSFGLREILRKSEVYSLHPEPEVAAAIMVSDSFRPQMQAALMNYTKAAAHLNVAQALQDSLHNCACRSAFKKLLPADLSADGHVITSNTCNLRWDLLSQLTRKGKKFRLPCSLEVLIDDLDKGLVEYVEWASQSSTQPERLAKLENWAAEVRRQALRNWRAAMSRAPLVMEGFPGLREAITEAQKLLVFTHDDRGPHGLAIHCRRKYEKEMAVFLSSPGVFETCTESWETVSKSIKQFLSEVHFPVGNGLPYSYGMWKPIKGSYRFITGTRRQSGAIEQPVNPPKKPARPGPPRAPLYFLAKHMVNVLKHVCKTLQDIDQVRISQGGPQCYWSIDSVDQFTKRLRAEAAFVVQHPQRTVDFTTMYTELEHKRILTNVEQALAEAWEYHTSSSAHGMGVPLLSAAGWSWDVGWSKGEVMSALAFLVHNAYVINGGNLQRQIKGLAMGLPPAPQIATLTCYPVEKAFALATLPTGLCFRLIDDIYANGMEIPSEEMYNMKYKETGSGDELVCIGVKVSIWGDKKGNRLLHTTLYDREDSYPYHLERYPDWDTVAPKQQFGGVLMGRFVACQEACATMQDFKESVGNVLRRAISRGYPFSLVAGVWSRFLFRRWQAGDIRRKELVSWLHRAWRYFDRQQLRSGDTQPWGPVRPQSISPEFLAAFGVNTSGPATSPDPPTSSGPAAQPADPPLSDPPLSDPESHGSVS